MKTPSLERLNSKKYAHYPTYRIKSKGPTSFSSFPAVAALSCMGRALRRCRKGPSGHGSTVLQAGPLAPVCAHTPETKRNHNVVLLLYFYRKNSKGDPLHNPYLHFLKISCLCTNSLVHEKCPTDSCIRNPQTLLRMSALGSCTALRKQ